MTNSGTLLFEVQAFAKSPPKLPTPKDVTLEMKTPSGSVAKDIAVFAGKWGGYWGDVLPSNLIVEDVGDQRNVAGVYLWGDNKKLGIVGGGEKFRGEIVDGVLKWGDAKQGIGFEFKPRPDGKLGGERYNAGHLEGAIVMSRM